MGAALRYGPEFAYAGGDVSRAYKVYNVANKAGEAGEALNMAQNVSRAGEVSEEVGSVADKLDEVGKAGEVKPVQVPKEPLETSQRFNEEAISDYAKTMSKNYTEKDIENLTKLTTHNEDSPTALLGYFESDNRVMSYEQIAYENGWTYFDAGNNGWTAMENVDNDLAPKINRKFLEEQISAGKDFILTSDPYPAKAIADSTGRGASYADEIDLLTASGYKFEKYGNFWRAFK